MKTSISLAVLCLALVSHAQPFVGSSANYRGNYLGVLTPSPHCSNERLLVAIAVNADGDIGCGLLDYDENELFRGRQSWPFFNAGKFTTDITELGDFVRGKFSAKGGTCKGTVSFGGCRYTFTARYKVPPL